MLAVAAQHALARVATGGSGRVRRRGADLLADARDAEPCPSAAPPPRDLCPTGLGRSVRRRKKVCVCVKKDIYGCGTPVEDMSDWMAASSAHRGNPDLYMSKISAAIDKVKSYDFVDTTKVAVIGRSRRGWLPLRHQPKC